MPSLTGRVLPTLQKRAAPLAAASVQRARLDSAVATTGATFQSALAGAGLFPLRATGVEIFQVNVGRKCNQTCRHCHVDAGPDRNEMMPDEVMDRCLQVIETTDVQTVDITGGAPELHKRWRELVERSTAAGKRVMDRCNLTIAQLPNYRYLPAFFAEHRVEVVASLPHYRAKNTDAQRGDGVFEDSLATLRELNRLGYGQVGSGLSLTLVSNPVGTYLPGNQAALEADWRRQLRRLYNIEFTNLFTITNMPISRFLDHLEETGQTEAYLTRLVTAFNPAAAANVMCRNTLSVAWDGALHDCDFNQMLALPTHAKAPQTIFDWDLAALDQREITLGAHCFGCTAGAGSSCGGATSTTAASP